MGLREFGGVSAGIWNQPTKNVLYDSAKPREEDKLLLIAAVCGIDALWGMDQESIQGKEDKRDG